MWFGSALGDLYYPEGRRLGRQGKLGAAAGSPPGTVRPDPGELPAESSHFLWGETNNQSY